MELRIILILFLVLFSGCTKPPPLINDLGPPASLQEGKIARVSNVKALTTALGSADFSWQWTQAPNTPDIVGFKLLLGTASQSYTRIIDIAGADVRSFVVTGLDLGKFNYAAIQSYTSFGQMSVASPELVFGGTPSSPVFLKAAPVTP